MSTSQEAFRPSPQQELLWTSHPAGPTARTQVVATLDAPVDAAALREGFDRVVARHEILRTTFSRSAGIRIPPQVVHDELAPGWETSELRGLAPEESSAQVARLADAERRAPLDLDNGPLVRVAHVVLDDARHVLVITASALCLDAATAPALLAELASQWGAQVEVAEEPLQYADYAEWQHELAASEDADAQAARAHWATLAGLPASRLPFARDAIEDAPGDEAGDSVDVPYGAELATAVVALAERYGVTPEAVLHAAWLLLIARFSTGEDVVSALLDGGPGRDPLDGLIGPSARPLPLRTPVVMTATFAELLAGVDRARSQALAWEDSAPLDATQGLLLGFATSNGFAAPAPGAGLRLETLTATAPSGVWLIGHDLAGTPRVRIADSAGALPHDALEELAGRLRRLLEGATADPDTPVGRLELHGAQERRRILEEFNDTATGTVAPTVQERFAAHVEATPDAPAVDDGVTTLSYGELAGRAAGLTAHLRALGVERGAVVGLCTDRSVDMATGILGILNAGAAFLPLHPNHPQPRLARQIEDAGCRFVVTQQALSSNLPQTDAAIVDIADEAIGTAALEEAGLPAQPGDLAYVIYTSGSSGVPKGVGVTNANLANYVGDMVERLGAGAEPLRFAMMTALSTDLGHTAVFPALASGGTLALVSPTEAADGASLAHRLDRTPVDVMKITPSHLGALLAAQDGGVLPLRTLVIGGERLGWDVVERVRSLGGATIVNHYGPTETTIGSCTLTVPEAPGPWAPASVPIGHPIANTRCYVLDRWGEPVAIGAPGALFIAGAGVAPGYVGRPELTAERFSPDPFAGDGVMYDTGDLARWLPDGTLEYLGRADEQVKIRGFRVEPGEVEAALRAHPAIREVAVVVRDDAHGHPRLVAYCAHGPELSQAEMASHTAGLVPDYMIPAVFVSLDTLPLTPSGKVDARALPDPAEPGADGDGWVEPSTPLERAVAALWSDVLGIERIGADDDFFALGGHSLLAAQVVAQVRTDFAVELPMHSLFTMPTVATLSEEIGRLLESGDQDETARLLASVEGMSDEEVERMLAEQSSPDDG